MKTANRQPPAANDPMRSPSTLIGCSRVVKRWMLIFLLPFAIPFNASHAATILLQPVAQVDGEGVFLQQIVQSDRPLPAVRLCDSPLFGKTAELTRAQVSDLLAAAAPDFAATNLAGAEVIRISRRTRTLDETQMLNLLAETLQRDYVKDQGELELKFQQPWSAIVLPDEALTLNVVELPTAGVTPTFIVRFTLGTAHETLGTWQASLQSHVWREVWVAHSALQRGEPAAGADLARERRDVLNLRDPLADFSAGDSSLQIAEFVPANGILLARALKPRAVIHRGQTADAMVEDGALSITMKVEALEDGAPGQTIRLRNPASLRNLSGKVLNEQTILISL